MNKLTLIMATISFNLVIILPGINQDVFIEDTSIFPDKTSQTLQAPVLQPTSDEENEVTQQDIKELLEEIIISNNPDIPEEELTQKVQEAWQTWESLTKGIMLTEIYTDWVSPDKADIPDLPHGSVWEFGYDLNFFGVNTSETLFIDIAQGERDFTKYDKLRFYVKGDTDKFRIGFQYINERGLRSVIKRFPEMIKEGIAEVKEGDGWDLVEIDLKTLKERNKDVEWNNIRGFMIETNIDDFEGVTTKGELFFKDICFTLDETKFTKEELHNKLFSLEEIKYALTLRQDWDLGDKEDWKQLRELQELYRETYQKRERDIDLKDITSLENVYLQAYFLEELGYQSYIMAGLSKCSDKDILNVKERWDYFAAFKDKKLNRIGVIDNQNMLTKLGLNLKEGIYYIDVDKIDKIPENKIFKTDNFTIQRFNKNITKFILYVLEEKGIDFVNEVGETDIYYRLLEGLFKLPHRFWEGLEKIKISKNSTKNYYQENKIILHKAPNLIHEATHHLDLSNLSAFRTNDGSIADLSRIFYNISWQLDKYSGRKKREDSDRNEFVTDYGMENRMEDIADTFAYSSNDDVEISREQMQQGSFELATKLLIATYLLGFDKDIDHLYDYKSDILPLTFEEVENKIKQAQANNIKIPPTTLESFNAAKIIYYKLRKKLGYKVPKINLKISKDTFPHLYPEVSIFTKDKTDSIKHSKKWQDAITGLNQLEAKIKLSDMFEEDVVALIKDDAVTPLVKKLLAGFISDSEKLERLVLDKSIDISLRKQIAYTLIKKIPNFNLQNLTRKLIENENLKLAKFILKSKTLTDEEKNYNKQSSSYIKWDNLVERLIKGVENTPIEDLVSRADLNPDIGLEKMASLLTSSLINRALSSENIINEIIRIGEKQFYQKLKSMVYYKSLKLYQAIMDKFKHNPIENLNPDKLTGPDLKGDIWNVLSKEKEILKIADFNESEFKERLGIKDFGSYNKYEKDLTQRANDAYSRNIRYGREGYAERIDYDVDSSNDAEVGFWMMLKDIDASNYNYLKLHLKGDGLFGYTERIKIELKNKEGEVGSYYLEGINDNWQEFNIPLDEFEGIEDLSSLTEIVIVFNKDEVTKKEGRVYLDLVGLSRNRVHTKEEIANKMLKVIEAGEEVNEAVNVLGRLGVDNEKIKNTLLDLLSNEDTGIQALAAEAVGRLKIEESKERLIQLFESKSKTLRYDVLRALIQIDAQNSIIDKALKDKSWKVKKLAIESLKKAQIKKYREKLVKIALEEDSWQLRVQAILKLAEVEDESLNQVFKTLLLDDSPWIKLAAFFGLNNG